MNHKRLLSLLLAVILLVSLSPTVFAAGGSRLSDALSDFFGGRTYYIDSRNGSDYFNGLSPLTPFKTLEKAFDRKFEPGTTVLFCCGGTYRAGFTTLNAWIQSSGTAEDPITLGSYGKGKRPVITTPSDENLLLITGSYINISDLDFTAPNGMGIRINSINGEDICNVNIDNCRFYNIYNKSLRDGDPDRGGIRINNDHFSRVHDCRFTNLEFFDSAYGIDVSGVTYEFGHDDFISTEASYNYNLLFDNIYCHDLKADALILGALRDSTVRNSRFINTASNVPFACAAVWTHGCDRVTVEYCEIAGSKNLIDGMAIDFDGWSTNCTYRYIYSHDNNRFMRNCLYDGTTKNRGNTVDHCLSVNDNTFPNIAALPLTSSNAIQVVGLTNLGLVMDGFTFTNNYLINCSPFYFGNLTNANISNNYFGGKTILTAAVSVPRSVLSATFTGTVRSNTFFNYTPLLGLGNKLTLRPVTAQTAYAQLFPNGVHTP